MVPKRFLKIASKFHFNLPISTTLYADHATLNVNFKENEKSLALHLLVFQVIEITRDSTSLILYIQNKQYHFKARKLRATMLDKVSQ